VFFRYRVKIEFLPSAFILDPRYQMQSKSVISKRSRHLTTLSQLHDLCNVDHIWIFETDIEWSGHGPVNIPVNRDWWHQRKNVRIANLPAETRVGTFHNCVQAF